MFAKIRKLGDVVDIVGGGTPSKANESFYEGSIPWATVRDMKQEHLTDTELKITLEAVRNSSTNIIKAGNIIIATRVGLGKVCRLQQDTAINQDLKALIPKNNDLDRDYLFWWLKSVANLIVEAGTGATVQGVKIPFIKALDIPLPSISEQKRIVAILSQAFSDIDKARATAGTNLKNAREMFESYLQQVFSQRGEGWLNCSLATICTIKPPKSEARKVLREDDLVSFVPMNCLGIDRMNLDLIETRQLKDVSGSYTYFANNDVLLAKITPCFENGKLGLASNLINGVGFGSSEFIVFRCHEGLDPKFLYYFLSRKSFLDEGKMRMTGAVGHRRVTKEFIENYPIWFPSTEQQARYLVKIDYLLSDVTNLVEIYGKKNMLLEDLKRSILHKAFTGELTKSKGIAA